MPEPEILSESSSSEEAVVLIEEEEEVIPEEENLFQKNTLSFQCLAQIEISRSSIFRDPFYYFPEIEDPHLEEALWADDPSVHYDDIGVERYKDLCKQESLIPFRRVINALPDEVLDLKFYGLNEREMRTICQTLEYNNYITHLILQENYLRPEALVYLVSLIECNLTITSLDMKLCQIGCFGAEILSECFAHNTDIVELDLSYNSLGDEGLAWLADGLRNNTSIKILNLSHNDLGDEALFTLRPILEDNYMINDLDLSWNYFYKPTGMKQLMEGLAENLGIVKLNLAWNGIGDKDTVRFIMLYLKTENTKLQHLDLSNNRLTGIPVKMLYAGLKVNEVITTLNIGFNPLTADEVEFFAGILLANRPTPANLNFIDFGETWVKKSFIQVQKKIEKKEFSVSVGGIYSNYKIKGPVLKEVLLKRAKFVALKPKKKKQKKNVGEWLLGLTDDPLTKDEFTDKIKKAKIKLDNDLVQLMLTTWENREKKVNVVNMKEVFLKLYPDTKPPEPKKKKGKGKGKGKKGKGGKKKK